MWYLGVQCAEVESGNLFGFFLKINFVKFLKKGEGILEDPEFIIVFIEIRFVMITFDLVKNMFKNFRDDFTDRFSATIC